MRRREFLGSMAGVAATILPAIARAQPTTPLIGFLHPGSPETDISRLPAFRQGLGEAGFSEGRNVAIEFRWAHGDNSRLPELAADLVRRQVAVIVTVAGTAAALAAKA
ncbi:MAG: ABC transporter substrate-binding protein, partial [Pseudolabrys sp.]